MFDMGIGMSEMLLLAVIALVIFGPEKFPEYAKIFMRAMRDIRGYVNEVKTDVAKEINPLKRELDQLNRKDPEKLLDALMQGAGASDTAKKETPAASVPKPEPKPETAPDPQYDTANSDADAAPYGDAATPETPLNTPGETDGADSPYIESQDFDYNPPERMD